MSITGQEPNTNQDPAGQEPAGNSMQGGSPSGADPQPEPKTFDEAYVSKLRAEAAANRKKAADLQAQIDEAKKAELSEIERAKADAQQAQETAAAANKKWLDAQRDNAIIAAAAKAGFSTKAALKMADVEVAEDGTVTGADEAIQQLIAEFPAGLVQQAGTGSNGSSMNGSRAKKKTLTREDLKGKSPEWINENWEAVQEVLAKK